MGKSQTIGFILAMFAQTWVFWGLGGACFVVALKAVLEHDYMFFISDALDTDKIFSTSAYLLIAGGCILILLGFFGPIIVCVNKPAAFYVLAVVQVLIGILLLLAGLLSGITRIEFKDEQMHEQGEEMAQLLEKHYGYLDDRWKRDFTNHWDHMQRTQRCCGPRSSSWQAFRSTEWFYNEPGEIDINRAYVPQSCCYHDRYKHVYDLDKCQLYENGPPKLPSGENEAVYGRGCNHAMRDFVYEYSRYFMALGITTGLVVLIGIILPIGLGCVLARNKRDKMRDQLDNSASTNLGNLNQAYGYHQGRPQRYMYPSSSTKA